MYWVNEAIAFICRCNDIDYLKGMLKAINQEIDSISSYRTNAFHPKLGSLNQQKSACEFRIKELSLQA